MNYPSCDAVRGMSGKKDLTDEQINEAAKSIAERAGAKAEDVHPMLVAQEFENE